MTYALAAGTPEMERLHLQSLIWEPAGRALLEELPAPARCRALDIGCGPLGWLRILSGWAGPAGRVVGTDVAPTMLAAARNTLSELALQNVEVVYDDLFRSALEPRSWDLVHARFQIAPLGRAGEQLEAYRGLCRSGGRLVLEDLDPGSWHFNPPAPAAERLIGLLAEAFAATGGDLAAGRCLPSLLRAAGLRPEVRTTVLALRPGDPYLASPLQIAVSLRSELLRLVGTGELTELLTRAAAELQERSRWGTTFTLVQAWCLVP